jgi:hypothetical protein
MSLGDACAGFNQMVIDAIKQLQDDLANYSEEPHDYSLSEVRALLQACEEAMGRIYDRLNGVYVGGVGWEPGDLNRLVRLVETVRAYHDTPPAHDQLVEEQRAREFKEKIEAALI